MPQLQSLAAPAPSVTRQIPRIIHRIWLGDAPLPADYEAYGASWARHHPGWEQRLWRDGDLPPLRNQALFDAATSPAQKSDIARYELLATYGGVYADTDFECLRSFDELIAGEEAFIGSEDGVHLSIGLMGGVAGHPLFEALIAAIPASIAADPNGRPNHTTGPHLATRVVNADPRLRERVRVFEPDLFYPYLYNENYRRDEQFPASYAVHHWAASWLPDPTVDVPPRYRIVLATDWSDPAPAVALVTPFARLFGPDAPIELVLAVPHDPGERDLAEACSLLDALAIDGGRCAPLTIESFAEAGALAHDLAVVPGGDGGRLVVEIGRAVSWLHDIAAQIERHGRPALAAARGLPVAGGDRRRLAERLSCFAVAPALAPEPPPAPPAPPAAPGHRATYVGNDRVLVSTTWGGKLFMSASDLSLTPEVLHDGNYDEPFTHYVMRTLRAGDVVFDVGANVGLFTVLMARLVGPQGHVVAYEAAPANVALLRDNVAMNYLGGWVDVVPKAAAATEGRLPFFASTRFQGNGSLRAHDDAYARSFAVDGEQRVEVEAEPLDVHLDRFARIDLLKIDVEGGEEQVFAGMERLVAAGVVRRICFELLRERMGADWDAMGRRLARFAADGWTLSVPDERGLPLPASVDELLRIGSFPQVLLTRG